MYNKKRTIKMFDIISNINAWRYMENLEVVIINVITMKITYATGNS